MPPFRPPINYGRTSWARAKPDDILPIPGFRLAQPGLRNWYLYIAVIAAGFAAGFINTLPLLIFLGLPANVANGTNRVGVLLQNGVGVGSFRRRGVLDVRGGLILAVPAMVGSIPGAQIAVNLNEEVMLTVIGVLMVVMLVVLIRPRRWLEGRGEVENHRLSWSQVLIFFAIGV